MKILLANPQSTVWSSRQHIAQAGIWRKAINPDTWRRLPEYASNFGRFFLGRKTTAGS